VPLFPAHDSADVWAHRDYFQLDAGGQPIVLAGVPPDRFSATGQRWGNPVYDWRRLVEDGFRWWIDRMRTELQLFDFLRLDHFRGLQAVWEIPATDPTAQFGQWRPAPGRELLNALQSGLGSIPLIAEDLGLITPEVHALRLGTGVPGMKVLQFAFDSDSTNPYLPHNHEVDFVVYTGTHDNNTTLGWYKDLDPGGRTRVLEYLGNPQEPMPWPLIRAALASVCKTALVPMQDVLALDAADRINTPGTLNVNWRWRLNWDLVTGELAARLRDLNSLYGRL
ncbi:MAG: 4-alpha-glucanotransferase, partial [Gammaproteobacteria bacterium]